MDGLMQAAGTEYTGTKVLVMDQLTSARKEC